MPVSGIKLNIAGLIIGFASEFPQDDFARTKEEIESTLRYKKFFYYGKRKPSIFFKVKVVEKLPQPADAKDVFITYHPEDGKENWRFLKTRGAYIYRSPLDYKKQLMRINNGFNRVTAYLLPKKRKRFVWDIADIIYDFLQVLLIAYLARRKTGLFVHAVGIKDSDGRGLLFAGKSGSGKTTSAKIWHRYSDARILNDDRIAVRRIKGRFFMYGTPWHGTFNDYLVSIADSASLERIFFIYQHSRNTTRPLSQAEAFGLLYPAIIPPFWDKECLEKTADFGEEMLEKVPCFSLGFVKDKSIIPFVRKL